MIVIVIEALPPPGDSDSYIDNDIYLVIVIVIVIGSQPPPGIGVGKCYYDTASVHNLHHFLNTLICFVNFNTKRSNCSFLGKKFHYL